jgi:hypothetical protein
VLQLRDAVEKRNKELRTLEKRINEITDRIYKEFSKSVGVANIREYEENRLKDAQNVAEERLNLSSQLAKLKYQCVPSSLYFFFFSSFSKIPANWFFYNFGNCWFSANLQRSPVLEQAS